MLLTNMKAVMLMSELTSVFDNTSSGAAVANDVVLQIAGEAFALHDIFRYIITESHLQSKDFHSAASA